MRYSAKRSRESGVVLLALLAVLVVAIAVVAFVFVHNKQKDETAAGTSTNTSSDSSQSSAARNAENVRRKSDGLHALTVLAVYMSDHQGSVPGTADMLDFGGFAYYQTADLLTGEQPAVTTDMIRLVTRATCNGDGSTSETTSLRSYVVQYSVKAADGSFTPVCVHD